MVRPRASSPLHSRRRSRGAALAACAALATLAAGCGGDSDAGEGGAPAAGAPAAAAAKERIERFRGLPRFRAPGPAFDARGALRGKRIFEIPITSEVPFIAAVEKGMRQAAEEVGAELVASDPAAGAGSTSGRA